MDDVLAEADRNMREAWERIIARSPRPGRGELGGVLALSSGIDAGLFNPAHVVGEVGDAAATVDAVQAHYAGLGVAYSLVFRDAVAPGLSDACVAAGLVEHWQMPLMVLDPIPDDAAPPVAGLEVRAVTDESDVEPYGDVLSAGFGMPRPLAAAVMGASLLLETPGFTGFLGVLDGQPVAASGVFVTGDVAGVYNVATVERARGRGVGAAITWAAALAGRDAGATRSILQASPMGEPVYTRMGYATPARYRQFEPATPS
jgi:GNAT superfamily N-acetyltransferase